MAATDMESWEQPQQLEEPAFTLLDRRAPEPQVAGAPGLDVHNPRTPMSLAALVAMSAAWAVIAAVTTGFSQDLLPALALGMRAVPGDGMLTGLALVGLALPILLLPAAGRWSDQLHSSRGRRRAAVMAGGALILPGLLLAGLAGDVASLIVAFLIVQAGASVAQAGLQPMLSEAVPRERRGLGAGLKGSFEVLGAMAAGGAAMFLLRGSAGRGALALLGLALLCGVLTLVAYRRRELPPPHEELTPPPSLFRAPSGPFRAALASRVVFVMAAVVMQAGVVTLVQERFPASAERSSELVLGGLLLGLLLASLLGGALADRAGRRGTMYLGVALAGLGALGLLAAAQPWAVVGGGALIALGMGAFLSASWALLADLAPRVGTGRSLGVAGGATAAALLLGIALVQVVPLERSLLAAALLAGLAALPLRWVPEPGSARPLSVLRKVDAPGHSGG